MVFTPDHTKRVQQQLVAALEYLIGSVVDGTRPASEQAATAAEYMVYLLEKASTGQLDWQESILSQLNFVTSEPAGPVLGDRYLNTATGNSSVTTQAVVANSIYTWDSNANLWIGAAPTAGAMVFDENTGNLLGYNGSAWVTIGTFAEFDTLTTGGNADGLHHHNTLIAQLARSILANATNAAAAPSPFQLAALQVVRCNAAGNALEATARRVQVHTVTAGEATAQAVVVAFGLTAIASTVSYRTAAGAAVLDWTAVTTATQVTISAGATAFVAGDVVTVTAEGA
jgi:hypothetical protein